MFHLLTDNYIWAKFPRRQALPGSLVTVPTRNKSYGAVRQEMIQASINCIQKRLESNNIEDVMNKFLSASCAEELAEFIRNLADDIPDIELNQAFHE